MNQEFHPDEKRYAEMLAEMLQNGVSYLTIQTSLMKANVLNMDKLREHLGKLVPKGLLVQHDLEIELERWSYRNHQPTPDTAFEKMINTIQLDLETAGLLKEKETKPRRMFFAFISKYKWAMAATFLGLIGLVWFFEKQSVATSETLFAANFEPFPDQYSDVIEKQIKGFGAALNLNRLVAQKDILAAYAEGDYEKTITLSNDYFEEFPPNGLEGDEEIYLYLGISYLEQRQSGKAIEVLMPLANNTIFSEQSTAKWYLALAWIRQKEFEKAKDLLQIISQDNRSLWQTKASELLEKLERFPKK